MGALIEVFRFGAGMRRRWLEPVGHECSYGRESQADFSGILKDDKLSVVTDGIATPTAHTKVGRKVVGTYRNASSFSLTARHRKQAPTGDLDSDALALILSSIHALRFLVSGNPDRTTSNQ